MSTVAEEKPSTPRLVSPSQFLTKPEMLRALTLYAECRAEQKNDFAQRFANEVTRPNLQRIENALGQKCDPMYLAYAVENALNEAMIEVPGEANKKKRM